MGGVVSNQVKAFWICRITLNEACVFFRGFQMLFTSKFTRPVMRQEGRRFYSLALLLASWRAKQYCISLREV